MLDEVAAEVLPALAHVVVAALVVHAADRVALARVALLPLAVALGLVALALVALALAALPARAAATSLVALAQARSLLAQEALLALVQVAALALCRQHPRHAHLQLTSTKEHHTWGMQESAPRDAEPPVAMSEETAPGTNGTGTANSLCPHAALCEVLLLPGSPSGRPSWQREGLSLRMSKKNESGISAVTQ